MTSSPDANPDTTSYTYVLTETQKAVGDWWVSNLLERLVGTMIGHWIGRLRLRTDRWMAQVEAAEKAQDIPATEPKQEARPRPAASPEAVAKAAAARAARRAKLEELEPWKLPPQWTMPCTWPAQRAARGKCREFGWLNTHMKFRAGPYSGLLQALVKTEPMVRLFQNSPVAVRGWLPLCWMFGVDGNLVRHAGAAVPKRRSRPRVKLTPREKWQRAMWRDPKPKVRMVERTTPCPRNGMRSIVEIKPKGNVFMDINDPPDIRRTG
jgi:hypothetical protein